MSKTSDGSDVDFAVSQRMRARRLLLGWSQEKLAERMSLSAQQIHKYEKGLSRLTVGRLVQMAKALSVPTAYFFDDPEGSTAIPPELFEQISDPKNVQILNMLAELPPSSKQGLLILLRAFCTDLAGGPVEAAAPLNDEVVHLPLAIGSMVQNN